MLTDASENFESTWAFLDRRIDDAMALSKYKSEVTLFSSNPVRLVCVVLVTENSLNFFYSLFSVSNMQVWQQAF